MYRQLSILACLVPVIVFGATSANHSTLSGAVKLLDSGSLRISLAFDNHCLETERSSENGDSLSQMSMPGEGCIYVPGQPVLPAVSRFVVIPPNQAVELAIQEGETRRMAAERPPLIFTESTPNHTNTGQMRPIGGLFPPVVAQISDPVIIRGVRLVRVTTYPVQFDSASNTYLIRDNIQTDLRFTDGAPLNPVAYPVRHQRSRNFLNFIKGLAINGDLVGRDDPDYDTDPPYIGHYLVVCNAAILQYAAPFIEWRRREGYKVDILSVSANRSGDSNWIKQQIQAVYDGYLHQGLDPFDLILLIGYGDDGNDLATPNYGWDYACLEGNDDDADVGLAQWIAGNSTEMALFSGRTLSYEMTPYFNDTHWFQKGAVFAQKWANNWNISLHTNIPWCAEMMKAHNINDVRIYNNFDQADPDGNRVADFMMEQVNEGINLFFGRAEAYGIRNDWQNIRTTGIFPVYINYAGHQEDQTWMMMRNWDGQHLVGPVVGTNIYGGDTQTLSNSMLWLDNVSGLIERELPFGWARVAAVMAPEIYAPNFGGIDFNKQRTASYGDPGLQPWLGIPRVVHAVYPAEVTPSTRSVAVQVLNENNEPIPGAQVTVYFPGSMPDSSRANYATYNDMYMRTHVTDEDGNVRFVFEEGVRFVSATRMFVTVSGRDIKPFLANRVIGAPDAGLELESYSLGEISGNGDDAVNPGEAFSLSLTAQNSGHSHALDNVHAHVVSDSQYLEVVDNDISFGNTGAGESAEGDQPVDLTFSASCPDGAARPAMQPTALIEFSSEGHTWESAIKFDARAPHLTVNRVVGGNVVPDTVASIDIEITNTGRLPVGALNASLRSLGMSVFVIQAASTYDGVAIGHTRRVSGQRFIISGSKVAVPGSVAPMQLILTDNQGFTDTASFNLQIGTPRRGAPQGPDAYGYVCYDDSDTGWEIAPDYNWIEIDPRTQDFEMEGTRIGFRGQSPMDIGEAIMVRLPFDFQFYGQDYDRITVATNGFISVGDQQEVTNFQNWPMDRAMGGGAGMLSPLWDALTMTANGQVYYAYDEDNDQFIIEWSRMRHAQDNAELTFEVVIYGPTVRVTLSGDQDILFQYKTVSNFQGDNWTWDVPYASVGISSPRGDAGINYTFNNVYPVTSAALQNRRAILFSTSSLNLNAILYGYITDVQTGQPIEHAIVRTKHGFSAMSDANGYWRIPNAPSGVPFNITCGKQGYNDSTYTNQQVEARDSLEINFDLLHPEFTMSNARLDATLDSGEALQIPFNLTNTGNGTLVWSEEKRLLGDANTPPWEMRNSLAVGDTTNCNRIQGVAFTGDRFYLSGYTTQDSANKIFVLDRRGSLVNTFPQACRARYGFKDIEWDGQLLWGAGDNMVYGFTTAGEVVHAWQGPWSPTINIAWDSDRNILWLSGTTTNISPYDVNGNAVGNPLSRDWLRIYGLAYFPDDPDGYGLYINASLGGVLSGIYKMNPETGDTMLVSVLNMSVESTGMIGAYITNTYDVYSWVLLGIDNLTPDQGNDHLKIFQIEARKDWFGLDVVNGTLPPQERQNFVLSLNTEDLPDTLFEGELHFQHNADDGLADIPVALRVVGERPPGSFELLEPADGDTITASIGNQDSLIIPAVRFVWQTSNDTSAASPASYILQIQSGADTVRIVTNDTTLAVSFDTLGLPLEMYHQIEWWVEADYGRNIIQSFSRFHIWIMPIIPGVHDPNKAIPLRFGFSSLFPNPFNSMLTVRYGIERDGPATLRLYDLAGRLQSVLFDGTVKAGVHQSEISGQSMASGIYFLRIQSGDKVQVSKVALMR